MNARTAPQRHAAARTRPAPTRSRKAVLNALSDALCAPRASSGPGAPLRLNAETLADAFGITIPPHAADVPAHLARLLPLLAQGLHRDQIAAQLGISPAAAGSRIARLYRLLGAHNRVQAIRTAHEIGILPMIGEPR